MPNPTVTQTAILTAIQAVNLTTIGAVMVVLTPTPVQAAIHNPIVTQIAIPTAT